MIRRVQGDETGGLFLIRDWDSGESIREKTGGKSRRKKQGSKEYMKVQRDAGDSVRLVIIAHEFVHACGLENHSNNEGQDVFYGPLEPNSGDKPQDDYMKVPIKRGIRLPPVVLSAQTARWLRDIWQ